MQKSSCNNGSPQSTTNNNKQTYFSVPTLKALITHKITSWIYEENLSLPLSVLPTDILEYMTSKMPFCVIYRIYELKLAGEAIGLEFVKNYAETKQFEDETRNIIVKQLKIKHETKIGLWTAFRRAALRNPHKIILFWREFTKKERDVAQREIARRDAVKERKKEYEGKKKDKQLATEWGSKKLEEWKERNGKGGKSNSRTMMFHEYYDLVVKTAEKYSIAHIPLFLLKQIEDEGGLNEKVLRDLELEIKSFILKMKILTNDFLPLQRQCTTYAPLPIWIRPSPYNKDHKYHRASRTKLVLQQRLSSSSLSSLSSSPSSSPSSSSSSSSSSGSPPPPSSTCSPTSSETPSLLPSTTSSSSSSSTSASSSSSSTSPLSPRITSVLLNLAATSSRVARTEELVQQISAREAYARNALLALQELRAGDARKFAQAVDEEEREEEEEDSEGEKEYYINNFNTTANHKAG